MSNFFKTLKDAASVMAGRDLDIAEKDEAKKTHGSKDSKNSSKSTEAKDSKRTSKSELSSERLIDLLDYIGSEDLAKDFKNLFRSKKPSANLTNLIDAANNVLGIDAKDSKKDYKIEYNFVDPNTKERKNKQGEALLASGIQVGNLKEFNLSLEVIRVDKETGEKIQDGTEDDIKKIENLLGEQFSKDVSKR